ncbi:MFS transporter [Aristophania vespae]|uniref:MFS transporter n=1 Tax=Aristophania vespae TaxID=2697033 RepID=UPI001F01972E|nr:MFS transporter [Aristophania vespae]
MSVTIGSLLIEALGQTLIWDASNPYIALAGTFFTGLGCSMVFPGMGREVVRIVAPHLRGTALGGFSAFQDLAYGFTGPVAGLVADILGYKTIFLLGAATSILGFGLAVILRFNKHKHPA